MHEADFLVRAEVMRRTKTQIQIKLIIQIQIQTQAQLKFLLILQLVQEVKRRQREEKGIFNMLQSSHAWTLVSYNSLSVELRVVVFFCTPNPSVIVAWKDMLRSMQVPLDIIVKPA